MTAAAKEYGGALYALAAEEHLQAEVLQGLQTAAALFKSTPEYPRLLANPALQKAKRLALLDEAFRGNVHLYVLNFLKILCEKNGLGELSACVDEFCALHNKAMGILPVTAVTAVPLTETQMESMRKTLAAKTGKTIVLTNEIDAAVLGGVKLSYQGNELDGSVAGRLHALRQVLTA